MLASGANLPFKFDRNIFFFFVLLTTQIKLYPCPKAPYRLGFFSFLAIKDSTAETIECNIRSPSASALIDAPYF